MDDQRFARRVIEESDDDDLLQFLHFLEQTERSDNDYLAKDTVLMITLVNESLHRRRHGHGR